MAPYDQNWLFPWEIAGVARERKKPLKCTSLTVNAGELAVLKTINIYLNQSCASQAALKLFFQFT